MLGPMTCALAGRDGRGMILALAIRLLGMKGRFSDDP
jgi:hypothetical protein